MVFTTLLFLPQNMLPTTFAAPSYALSVSPTYIQEGLDTNITLNLAGVNASQTYTFKINVTTSANVTFLYNLTITTDGVGSGSNKTTFWKDFPSPVRPYLPDTAPLPP